MYTSARTFYVHFPRLEPGDVVELRYRVEDVAPRNEFADYFGEVEYMQSDEPIAHAEYVLITPKSAHVLLQRAARARPQAREEGEGDDRVHDLPRRRRCRLDRAEPSMPPWSEVLGHVHVSTYAVGQDLGAGTGASAAISSSSTTTTRELTQRITAGKTTTREKVRGRLRLRGQEDALRGARVRHPRLQAAPLRADLRARLRRLQRQGDAHRHDAATSSASTRRSCSCARGHARRLRDRAGEPRAVRSRHRVRAVARPLPRRHRRVHRLARAARDGSRRARAAGQRGQRQARDLAGQRSARRTSSGVRCRSTSRRPAMRISS